MGWKLELERRGWQIALPHSVPQKGFAKTKQKEKVFIGKAVRPQDGVYIILAKLIHSLIKEIDTEAVHLRRKDYQKCRTVSISLIFVIQ